MTVIVCSLRVGPLFTGLDVFLGSSCEKNPRREEVKDSIDPHIASSYYLRRGRELVVGSLIPPSPTWEASK